MTKINKNRVVWGADSAFPFDFGFCPNKAAWDHQMRKHNITHARSVYPEIRNSSGVAWCSEFAENGYYFVLITINDKIHETQGQAAVRTLIIHECVHVWQFLVGHINECNPSDEFEAYTVASICSQMLKAFANTRRLPKR